MTALFLISLMINFCLGCYAWVCNETMRGEMRVSQIKVSSLAAKHLNAALTELDATTGKREIVKKEMLQTLELLNR